MLLLSASYFSVLLLLILMLLLVLDIVCKYISTPYSQKIMFDLLNK